MYQVQQPKKKKLCKYGALPVLNDCSSDDEVVNDTAFETNNRSENNTPTNMRRMIKFAALAGVLVVLLAFSLSDTKSRGRNDMPAITMLGLVAQNNSDHIRQKKAQNDTHVNVNNDQNKNRTNDKTKTVAPVPVDQKKTVAPATVDQKKTVAPAPVAVDQKKTVAPTPGPTEKKKIAAPIPGPTEKKKTAAPTPGPTEKKKTAAPTPGPTEKKKTAAPTAGPTEKKTTAAPIPEHTEKQTTAAPEPINQEKTEPALQFTADPPTTRSNWLQGPYNRWGFKHITLLLHMDSITKGTHEAHEFKGHHHHVESITYSSHNETNNEKIDRTFADMLNETYTDAIVVLHKGRIILEKYFDNQTENTRHAIFSATESFAGLMASMLAHDDLLDPEALVTDYIPELDHTAFTNATVRQVMDMTTSIAYDYDYHNLNSEIAREVYASGYMNAPLEYDGPTNIRQFLTTLRKQEQQQHGVEFSYRTSNTHVLIWIIDRVLGGNGKSKDYFEDNLWSELRAEHDAFVAEDNTHFANFVGGAATTARDLARFGEMMRLGGETEHGKRLVSKKVVKDILEGGTEENVQQLNISISDTGMDPKKTFLDGWAYRNQYWVKPNHIFTQIGAYGQFCWVDVKANLVIVKQSSPPTPMDHVLLRETFKAFYALGEHYEEYEGKSKDHHKSKHHHKKSK